MFREFPRRLATALTALSLVVAGFVYPSPATAATNKYVEGSDPAAKLFDPTKVVDIQLTMSDEAIANLTQSMCYGGDYQPGTLTLTTTTATYGPMTVGIHLKGCYGSYRPLSQKAGFKIKINQVPNQTLLGLKKLTLNNNVQDPSMIHQALAYRLFRGMGVAAPRVGFANVSFNGQLYGLYSNVETYDKVSLARWYGAGQTLHLYEGSYGQDATAGRAGEFQIDEGNATITDLESLANANELDGTEWWRAMATRADFKQMSAMWATEFYMGHWDGYITRNNYYLHSTLNGKFTMLPWGTDQTFSWQPGYGLDEGPQGVMFNRCYSVPACKDLYAANIVKLKSVTNSLKLDAMVSAMSTAIDSSVEADPRKETDSNTVRWYQSDTANFVINRRASIDNWITANSVGQFTPSLRRSGATTVVSWTAPDSHGLTIDKYEVGVRRGTTWTTSTTTSTSLSVAHPTRTTLGFRVRAHTALGYGPWSAVQNAVRG
jgi:hypothetical protein